MDMDREYANGAFIPGSDALPDLWAQKAAAFRANLGKSARLGLPYGPEPRQALDLFLPQTTPRGLLVFVHGGYWLAMGRESWSHLAAGALARGWACAMPSYTLAPQARIRDITAEIANAVGHLAARMGCADHHHPSTARVVPISPLADLEPLLQTEMNQTLWLDPEEALAESPAHHARACDAHIWVGGNERPAFLWQARTLSESWDCAWTVDPGLHHFNVIDGLQHPDSALLTTCLKGL